MKKRFLVITLAALAVMSLAGYGTFALINANRQAQNTFTYGNLKISLSETTENPQMVIMPGATLNRSTVVTNVGSKDCFVRIRVDDRFINSTPVAKAVSTGSIKSTDCSYKLSGNGWLIKDDGYAYYEKALKPAEKTPELNISAAFGIDLDENLSNSKFETGTKAFAVQSDNNPIPEGGTTADVKGWPEDN